MQLTTEQIATIEKTLVLNGLNYEDIKLEVTDHIASEIEVLMNENSLVFEENLKIVFDKWKEQLKPSQSAAFLGRNFVAPKIVIDRLSSLKKREIITGFVFCFLITLLFYGMNSLNILKTVLLYVEFIIRKVFLLISILLIVYRIRLYQSKLKTTYSALFDKSFFLAVPFCVSISFGGFSFFRSTDIENLRISAVSATVLYGFFLFSSVRFLYKHYQILQKIKSV
jgi:hypothetical protein